MKYIKILVSLLLSVCFSTSFINAKEKQIAFNNHVPNKEYKRIVVLDPAVVENMFLLGEESKIVAIAHPTRSQIRPYEKTKDIPTVGTLFKPSLERIIAHKPDLVIVGYSSDEIARSLKSHNIPVLYLESNSLDSAIVNFKHLARVLRKDSLAGRIIGEKKSILNNLDYSKTKGLKGTFFASLDPITLFGNGTVPFEILNRLGIQNIVDGSVGMQPVISVEHLIQENPDFVIGLAAASMGGESLPTRHQALNNVNAWKNNNYISLPSAEYLRASMLIIDSIEQLHNELVKISNK